jgi:hypothetical protein
MNHKKLLSRMLALILVGLILASCGGTATLLPPTATAALVPPTATTIPSPTATPAPTAIPGSHDPMTVGDFTFQITEVQIADTLTNLPAGSISNYKGALKMTASGWVPADAKTGDKLLMVFTTLQSGNFQNFIDSNLKVVDGNSEISIVAILTQADNKIAIWVYGVNPASKSFLLVFPDGSALTWRRSPLKKGIAVAALSEMLVERPASVLLPRKSFAATRRLVAAKFKQPTKTPGIKPGIAFTCTGPNPMHQDLPSSKSPTARIPSRSRPAFPAPPAISA